MIMKNKGFVTFEVKSSHLKFLKFNSLQLNKKIQT